MRKQVIIIGGGFAGLHLAEGLRRSNFNVTLIDKFNHHQFQPLFYQVASARLEPANISFPFRKIFQRTRNIRFILDEVLSIETAENRVVTRAGQYAYDFVVIASGCTTNFFGNKEIEQHALSMKSTVEAINIRNEILLDFERFFRSSDEGSTEGLNIVIVGGGPTGVELAGAFAEMKKHVLPKDYPQKDFSPMRIYLVEGSPNTLNSMSEKARTASRKYLEKMGVSVLTSKIVSSYDGKVVTLKSGETIPCINVIWAAGVRGNIIAGLGEEVVAGGRYKVDRQNRVEGFANVYAVGDIAKMVTPKYPNGHPQLANVAINQARMLAKNLKRQEKGKELLEYEYRDKGSMATIGKYKAVVDLPFMSFHGVFAWFVWMFLHLMLILSAKNKLMIFVNWSWHYFTNDTSLRLILKDRRR